MPHFTRAFLVYYVCMDAKGAVCTEELDMQKPSEVCAGSSAVNQGNLPMGNAPSSRFPPVEEDARASCIEPIIESAGIICS